MARSETTAGVGVLADRRLDEQLARDGIVGPLPVLDPDTTARLAARLAPLIPPDAPFYAMHRPEDSPEHRRELSDVVRSELADPIAAHLGDRYRLLLGCHLFAKQPADGSYLGLHQDWTFVDEDVHRSGSFWIPLVDTDERNGRFHAVVGSHRVGRTYRGSPLWPYPWAPFTDELEAEFLTPFDTPAGSALAYDHRLIHGSFANRSSASRIAVVAGFVPRDVPLVHHYLAPDGRMFRCTVTDEFFLDLVIGPPPSGPHVLDVEEVHLEVRPLERADLEPFRPARPARPAPRPGSEPRRRWSWRRQRGAGSSSASVR